MDFVNESTLKLTSLSKVIMENDGGNTPTPPILIETEVEQVKKTPKKTPIKTPRRSHKLKETTTRQSKATDPCIIHVRVEPPPPMKAKVMKPNANRKLVLRKNTRLVSHQRKNTSQSINMFSLIVDNFLDKWLLIEHDESVFGYASKTLLNKTVCQVIIKFSCLIELWAK